MNSELDRLLAHCATNDLQSVLLGLCDIDGLLRGKFVDIAKFAQLMESSGGFCNAILNWDVDDHLYDFQGLGHAFNAERSGWQSGFPDVKYRLDPQTERYLPNSGTPFFLGEFIADDSAFHPLCPRSLLRKVCQLFHQQGMSTESGFEYEFFTLKQTQLTENGPDYANLRTFSKGRNSYSVVRAASTPELTQGLMKYCREFDIGIEGLHLETDPGTWEVALQKNDVLTAADCAILFKSFSKVYFRRMDWVASFMAKWSMNFPGQSGHFHFSFVDRDGKDLLKSDNGNMNEVCRFVLGGLTTYLPEWLPMMAPNSNSFTRLCKGAWAPSATSWGFDNRTCALRVIESKDGTCHIENRIPGADSNPYLVGAATLAAAALGIHQKIEPPNPVHSNAYEVSMDSAQQFSPTLREAAHRMARSEQAHEVFGSEFVDHFVASRLWESQESERNVTDWQLRRFFEVI